MARRSKKGLTSADIIAGLLILFTVVGLFGGTFYYKQREKILAEEGVEIHIVAKQWVFEPSEIVVKKGQKVTLIVSSADVYHGFMIEAYGINEVIPPSGTVKITFVADKAGTFEYRCSVYCGEPWPGSGMGHWIMRGILKVVED